MERSKIVAVITGAIALLLGIAYLVLVQLLDFRGEMLPAPQTYRPNTTTVAALDVTNIALDISEYKTLDAKL